MSISFTSLRMLILGTSHITKKMCTCCGTCVCSLWVWLPFCCASPFCFVLQFTTSPYWGGILATDLFKRLSKQIQWIGKCCKIVVKEWLEMKAFSWFICCCCCEMWILCSLINFVHTHYLKWQKVSNFLRQQNCMVAICRKSILNLDN